MYLFGYFIYEKTVGMFVCVVAVSTFAFLQIWGWFGFGE